jgi:cytochrome d ubiquinol oxidase subunit I
MVSLGSMFSAVWIVVANSWQQTPAGYHIVDKMGHAIPTPYEYDPFAAGVQPRAEIIDFWAMVFNPSSMARLSHVMVGAFILAAFFVMSICAYYIIKGRHIEFAKRAFKIALIFGMLSSVGPVAARTLERGHRRETPAGETRRVRGHFQNRGKHAGVSLRISRQENRKRARRHRDPGHAEFPRAS